VSASRCNQVVAAQKQLTIYELPNLLIVQLKRFDLMHGGLKINKSVVFTEELDLKVALSPESHAVDTKYELYAVLVHYGETCFSGHYTCFVKFHGTWYLFDDQQVTPVSFVIVLKQNAYILFYKRLKSNSRGQQTPENHNVVTNRKNNKQKNQKKNQTSKHTETSLSQRNIPEAAVSSSTLTSATRPKLLVPSVRAHYRTKLNSDDINDIVVCIDLPLVNAVEGVVNLQWSADGQLKLDTLSTYYLNTRLPFSLDISKSTATFYADVHQLVVVLIVDTPEDSLKKVSGTQMKNELHKVDIITVEKMTEKEKNEYKTLPQENEIEIHPIAQEGDFQLAETSVSPPSLTSHNPMEDKLNQAQQLVDVINREKHEAKYANLYKQIEEMQVKEALSAKSSRYGDVSGNPHLPRKTEKIGRNELCVCGSGKKYKKCHGAKE
jgi:hypothetical protein